ncbi:hypothetical protein [Streptomyces sp. WMMC940]|uniref:hypothetical protein n=1 Tax=Streptomyces sp. WMMC940 TaxID=3015153 RepID=UPI0022B71096|nr:hypothetical protein [Streptomyces sp. WMMC940]MCZ7460136.1 hypothetical protein [Streptomyces sp. WMMC940]
MASIRKREKKDGTATYQVRWLEGGRGGSWQDEKFGDQDAAEKFQRLVEAHDNRWPPGWVKGQGFVKEAPIPGDIPWLTYATRYVGRLTGIDERTREDYHREIRIHLSLLKHTDAAGHEYPPTVCNITQDGGFSGAALDPDLLADRRPRTRTCPRPSGPAWPISFPSPSAPDPAGGVHHRAVPDVDQVRAPAVPGRRAPERAAGQLRVEPR